jgi:cellulose synthase/poly-beta-1,6-N-acetylglucosamine synthase-like glycosyltransferase
MELDYPRGKLQIVVALDGPTDGTEFVVWRYVGSGVQMVHLKDHTGKPSALNAGMRRATGEIVVFADVRQTFSRDAIRRLVENFADRSVGAVTGQLVLLTNESTDRSSAGAKSEIGLYWKYETWIRAMESEVHSTIGATGAIYAIRRDCFEELPQDTLLDDVLTPMRVVLRGKRVVFETAAKAFDIVSCCPKAEFVRKVRTLTGNYQLLTQLPRLLAPVLNPVFWQFCSHKLGRLAVPYLLITMFFSNALISGSVYRFFFALQCAWYLCAIGGYVLANRELQAPPALEVKEERKAA